jgi:hypothetical protein
MKLSFKKTLMVVLLVVVSMTVLLTTSFVKTAQAGVTFGGLMYGQDISAWTPNEIICQNEQPLIQNDQEFRFEVNEIFYIDFRWHIKEQTSTTVTFVLQANDPYLGWQTVVFESATGDYGFKEKGEPGDEILRVLSIPECQESIVLGRMTGGGSIGEGKHGFELHCDVTKTPNRLEINWGKGNKFHLEQVTSAVCRDTLSQTNKPFADFDTYIGEGTGRFNGQTGYVARWTFTDSGEPGTGDHAYIQIFNPDNTVVATLNGDLRNGNHQAHMK